MRFPRRSLTQLQIGRFSHQPHHSGQPRVQNGPLIRMQIALQKPALIREEQAQAVNAERTDRVADGVAEERVLVLGGLDRLAVFGVGRRQNHRTVQRQRQRRREEETDGEHVRRVVVKVQVLIAGVRHPVQMTENAVGKAVAPGPEQQRPDHFERHIGKNREAECERHVIAHAELAANLHLAQRPGDERADRANRDELP